MLAREGLMLGIYCDSGAPSKPVRHNGLHVFCCAEMKHNASGFLRVIHELCALSLRH